MAPLKNVHNQVQFFFILIKKQEANPSRGIKCAVGVKLKELSVRCVTEKKVFLNYY